MNRTALMIAVLVAGAGVGLLALYKQRFESQAQGGSPVAVLMAVREVPPGTVIAEEHLGVRYLPEAYIEGRHIRVTDKESVIGIRAGVQLKPNETVQWTDLATGTSQATKLATLVRVGMRATSIQVKGVASSGLVVPGDRVDVLLTTNGVNPADRTTFAFMQNVLVVAVGANFSREEGAETERILTLTVAPEDAQRLTLAQSEGTLSAVLRNPDDVRLLDNLRETRVSEVLRNPVAAVGAAPSAAGRPSPTEKLIAEGIATNQANSEALMRKYIQMGGKDHSDRSKNKK